MARIRSDLWVAVMACAVGLACAPSCANAVDLPVGSPIYRVLDRLWAQGHADAYWPDRLPVRQEEVRATLSDHDPEWLGYLAEGTLDVRLSLGAGWASDRFVGDDHGGAPPIRGVGGGVRIALQGPFGASVQAHLPDREGGPSRFAEAYATFDGGRLHLTLGRENMWWGPGRRGDLLLTDNARAADMVRVENRPGFTLPGFLSATGEWRLSLFVGRIGGDRPPGAVPDPVFGGMKVSASPHPDVVISATRTFLYGGVGRDEDLGAFLDALFAREGDEWGANVVGNQIAGLSAIWRIPSAAVPVVLYVQAAGEDEANRQPSAWGFLAGAYLPRLGAWRKLDLRIEAASTDMPGRDSAWYEHPEYPYLSDGRVMGHPAGNDANDLNVEVGLFPSSGGWFGFSGTRTLSGVSGPDEDVRTALGVRGTWSRGPAAYALEWRSEMWDKTPPWAEEGTMWSATVQVRL